RRTVRAGISGGPGVVPVQAAAGEPRSYLSWIGRRAPPEGPLPVLPAPEGLRAFAASPGDRAWPANVKGPEPAEGAKKPRARQGATPILFRRTTGSGASPASPPQHGRRTCRNRKATARAGLRRVRPADALSRSFRAAGRCRPPYRSAWSTATHGRAVPGSPSDRRRGRADGWRKNGAGRAAWPRAAGPAPSAAAPRAA